MSSTSYGTGTMSQLEPGKWRLRVYVNRSGKGRQLSRTFKGTERAARNALRRFATEVEDRQVDPTRMTVGELLDEWLARSGPGLRPKTLAGYRHKIDTRIRPAFGSLRLDRLTGHMLDEQYREWRSGGLSNTSVHHLATIIGTACRQAVKWGWIATNPVSMSSPPPLRPRPSSVPEPDELVRLIRAAEERKNNTLATAIALSALTGARRGELIALRWSDIDMPGARLTISRSLTVVDGTAHVGPTKTHQVRVVALDPAAMEVLTRRWAEQQRFADQAGVPLDADPFVLTYERAPGADIHAGPDYLSNSFAKLCKETGVRCRFHDLRHFAATQMIGAGVDVRTVAGRLGHADASTTLRIYADALPERDREAAGVLGALIAPALTDGDPKRRGAAAST